MTGRAKTSKAAWTKAPATAASPYCLADKVMTACKRAAGRARESRVQRIPQPRSACRGVHQVLARG